MHVLTYHTNIKEMTVAKDPNIEKAQQMYVKISRAVLLINTSSLPKACFKNLGLVIKKINENLRDLSIFFNLYCKKVYIFYITYK